MKAPASEKIAYLKYAIKSTGRNVGERGFGDAAGWWIPRVGGFRGLVDSAGCERANEPLVSEGGRVFPPAVHDSENPYAPPPLPAAPAPATDDISRQLQGLQYPLTLSFKILAFASQATVTDANGRTVLYTKQKLLKFKEHVEIWTDSNKATKLADIRANKVIDWSARYFFTDSAGNALGSVGRRGWRSLWKAHYEVFKPGDETADFSIHEENPWTKVLDSIIGDLPIIGMFSGYFLHPSYLASRADGSPAMKLTKQAAFWEGRFRIDKVGNLGTREELGLFLSFLMLILLERRRG